MCTFTARREHAQRGKWYWRAYRKRGAVLHRTYLGKSGALTLEKLETAAATLAERANGVQMRHVTAHDERARHIRLGAQAGAKGLSAAQVDLAPGPPGFLQTKVMVPRLGPGLLERSALMERLSLHMHRTLTLVSAPAGFGKTTLLCLWCQNLMEQGRAVAWVALDQADNDPQRFWAYVARAFQPMFGDVAPHNDQLALLHQQPLETAVSTLLNTLTGLPHLITLVLDDYHVIVEQAIHTSLAYFIANPPPTVRVVLASRTDPPLQLARLRIRGELMELRAADLCLTVDEIGVFVTSILQVDLPGEVMERLASFSPSGAPHLLTYAPLVPTGGPAVVSFGTSTICPVAQDSRIERATTRLRQPSHNDGRGGSPLRIHRAKCWSCRP